MTDELAAAERRADRNSRIAQTIYATSALFTVLFFVASFNTVWLCVTLPLGALIAQQRATDHWRRAAAAWERSALKDQP
jgi:hypothetical protein